jgi:hypothetical protein
MPKFTVENVTEKPLIVAVEPWAWSGTLEPAARAHVEYNEPAEICFSVEKDGSITVSVNTDQIKITANGDDWSCDVR